MDVWNSRFLSTDGGAGARRFLPKELMELTDPAEIVEMLLRDRSRLGPVGLLKLVMDTAFVGRPGLSGEIGTSL